MAKNAVHSHTGENDQSVGTRATNEGFIWGKIAKTRARGQRSCDEVMTKWLTSPGHYANIHLGDITTMGAAACTPKIGP